jgi:tetratricopeptide (TPR) repeat protein
MKHVKKEINTKSRSKPLHNREVRGIRDALFSSLRTFAPALLAAGIAFIVFLPSLNNEFVNYDDGRFIYDNKHITSISLDFLKWTFTNREYQWSPLRWISHAVDYKIWRLNPFGHHLSSIILHSLNVFLVVILVFRLLGAVKLKMQPSPLNEDEIKFRRKVLITGVVTGLLFGIHPLRVESVVWISERKDVLYAFFFLLSLISYLSYCAFSVKKRRYLYYLLALVFFMMAVMSKAAAVTLPFVLILMDLYPLKRVNFRSGLSVWLRVFWEKLPFIGVSGAIAWINIGVHESLGALVPLVEVSFIGRALLAIKSISFYLWNTVWPFHLALVYGEPQFSTSEYIGSLFFVAGMTVACISLWFRGKRLWLAVWIYYIIMLLPVSVVKIYSFSFAHDRYTYMSSIGPFLLAGLGVAFFMERLKGKNKAILFSMLAVIFSILAGLTIKQTAVWKDSVTLWTSVMERTPSFVRAYYDRGTAYLMLSKYSEAIMDFDKVLESSNYSEAYNNRGIAYKENGDYQAAIRDFSKVIELLSGSAEAYNNRADAYVMSGNYQKALEDLSRAIELNPKHVLTRINLCSLNNVMGNYQKALEECSMAIEIDPHNASAYKRRGFSYNAMGNYMEAIRDYDRAVSLDSNDYEIYNFRGIARKNNGDLAMSINDFTKVIELKPGFYDVYILRGVTYGELGRLGDAIHDFTVAIGLRPKNADSYYNRGAAYYRLGREKDAMKDFRTAAGLGDRTVQKILRERGISY